MASVAFLKKDVTEGSEALPKSKIEIQYNIGYSKKMVRSIYKA
jgi:hypothetical protein